MVEPRIRHISAIDGDPDLKQERIPVDVGDAKSVRADKKEKKTEAEVMNDVLRTMMLDEKNRKWFYNLMLMCHILRNPFSKDALSTAFECGEMNIGQQVFIQLHAACPDLYLKMMEENNANRT